MTFSDYESRDCLQTIQKNNEQLRLNYNMLKVEDVEMQLHQKSYLCKCCFVWYSGLVTNKYLRSDKFTYYCYSIHEIFQ